MLGRGRVEKLLILFHKDGGSETGFVALLRQMDVAAGKDYLATDGRNLTWGLRFTPASFSSHLCHRSPLCWVKLWVPCRRKGRRCLRNFSEMLMPGFLLPLWLQSQTWPHCMFSLAYLVPKQSFWSRPSST